MIQLDFGKSDINYHDWADGKHGKTIYGPCLRLVKLETLTTKGVKVLKGRRLIFYFKSGAWWNFDAYYLSLTQMAIDSASR